MNWQKAKSEGDVCTTTLTGTRANVDRMVEIDRAVREHCYNHFDELLASLKEMLHKPESEHLDRLEDYNELIAEPEAIAKAIIAKCEEVQGI